MTIVLVSMATIDVVFHKQHPVLPDLLTIKEDKDLSSHLDFQIEDSALGVPEEQWWSQEVDWHHEEFLS